MEATFIDTDRCKEISYYCSCRCQQVWGIELIGVWSSIKVLHSENEIIADTSIVLAKDFVDLTKLELYAVLMGMWLCGSLAFPTPKHAWFITQLTLKI